MKETYSKKIFATLKIIEVLTGLLLLRLFWIVGHLKGVIEWSFEQIGNPVPEILSIGDHLFFYFLGLVIVVGLGIIIISGGYLLYGLVIDWIETNKKWTKQIEKKFNKSK